MENIITTIFNETNNSILALVEDEINKRVGKVTVIIEMAKNDALQQHQIVRDKLISEMVKTHTEQLNVINFENNYMTEKNSCLMKEINNKNMENKKLDCRFRHLEKMHELLQDELEDKEDAYKLLQDELEDKDEAYELLQDKLEEKAKAYNFLQDELKRLIH